MVELKIREQFKIAILISKEFSQLQKKTHKWLLLIQLDFHKSKFDEGDCHADVLKYSYRQTQ